MRHHANARHLLSGKSRARKRKLKGDVVMDVTNSPEMQRMLPY